MWLYCLGINIYISVSERSPVRCELYYKIGLSYLVLVKKAYSVISWLLYNWTLLSKTMLCFMTIQSRPCWLWIYPELSCSSALVFVCPGSDINFKKEHMLCICANAEQYYGYPSYCLASTYELLYDVYVMKDCVFRICVDYCVIEIWIY